MKGKKKWYLASIFFATRFIVMLKFRYFDENSDRPNRREHDGLILKGDDPLTMEQERTWRSR